MYAGRPTSLQTGTPTLTLESNGFESHEVFANRRWTRCLMMSVGIANSSELTPSLLCWLIYSATIYAGRTCLGHKNQACPWMSVHLKKFRRITHIIRPFGPINTASVTTRCS